MIEKIDIGKHEKDVIVIASSGIFAMRPEEFDEYDKNEQVCHGEEGINWKIYRVFYTGLSFSWEEARQYFRRDD